jgi:hypothetical protein
MNELKQMKKKVKSQILLVQYPQQRLFETVESKPTINALAFETYSS